MHKKAKTDSPPGIAKCFAGAEDLHCDFDRSRILRESRKGNPTGGVSFTGSQCFNLNLGKRDTMEIVKGVHDLAFVLVFIAIVMAPRAIGTYLAVRK